MGYGKTEVALRAVMKCVLGRQAGRHPGAHHRPGPAALRHGGEPLPLLPVEIRVLSRFQTPGQARQILSDLAAGHIDLLIGTHKLAAEGHPLQGSGLLVVDEEQRFGVTHKEKLKEMARQVTCSRCPPPPIPRR